MGNEESAGELDQAQPATYAIAIAASAGGLDALIRILSLLPADFPAAIVIVLHLQPDRESQLAPILSRRCHLDVQEASDGDVLMPSTVFVAPPDRHLVIRPGGVLALTDTPQRAYSRPSAEPLFESLAECYGTHGLAVVLTGMASDGSVAIKLVKAAGGRTIAQDEATSYRFSMPRASIATGDIDLVLPIDEIGPTLIKMVT
jgi:two-component system, chemotaxis family, protein-glutamate methylesterase/glutaminase